MRHNAEFFDRSDNLSFAEAGIPAHTFVAALEYPDYHRTTDKWQKLNYENMARLDRGLAAALTALANRTETPRWNEESKKAKEYLKAWRGLHPMSVPFAVFILFLAVNPFVLVPQWARLAIELALFVTVSRGPLSVLPSRPLLSSLLGIAVFVIWIGPDLLFPHYRQSVLFSNFLTGHITPSTTEAAKARLDVSCAARLSERCRGAGARRVILARISAAGDFLLDRRGPVRVRARALLGCRLSGGSPV